MNIKLNPAMRSVMHRTREVGLHKVARVMQGHDIDLSSVITKLGHDLTLHHQKHARIQDGIHALGALHDHGIVALEKQAFLGQLMTGAKNVWKGIGRFGARAGAMASNSGSGQRALNQQFHNAAQGVATPAMAKAHQQASRELSRQNVPKMMAGARIGRNVAQYGTAGLGAAGVGAAGYGMMGGSKEAGLREMGQSIAGAPRRAWDAIGDKGEGWARGYAERQAASPGVRAQAEELGRSQGLSPEEIERTIAEATKTVSDQAAPVGRKSTQYGAAGLGTAGLGGLGYGAYRAMSPDEEAQG